MNNQEKIAEIHLLDYVALIIRHRGIIVRNLFYTLGIVLLLSFILPQRFTSVTTLMPPQEQSKNGLESLLGEMSLPGLSLAATSNSSDILVEILKSRSVTERVLQRTFSCKKDTLPLFRCLKANSVEMGLIKMMKHARFMASKQGIISVTVEMGNRQLAADVANAFVEELDRINREKSVSRAKNSRIYIENQLIETESKMAEVTRRLNDFQSQYQAISLEDQTRAAIEQAGELKGQIISKQIQIGIMLQTMKPENPLVVRADLELQTLQRRYREMQFGGNPSHSSDDLEMPLSDVPQIGSQLAVLLREAKVQETVWELLNQQYYQAKIQEAKDTPTVQVLDRAVPPLFRSWPNRKMMLLIFGMLSVVLTILIIFLQEFYRALAHRPDEKHKIDRLLEEIKGDFRKIRITRRSKR